MSHYDPDALRELIMSLRQTLLFTFGPYWNLHTECPIISDLCKSDEILSSDEAIISAIKSELKRIDAKLNDPTFILPDYYKKDVRNSFNDTENLVYKYEGEKISSELFD